MNEDDNISPFDRLRQRRRPTGGSTGPRLVGNGQDEAFKPTIKIVAGEIPRIVNETEAALLAADRGLFKRDSQIVRVVEIETIAADERKTTALAIVPQDEHAILEDASAAADYVKFNKKEKAWLPADVPLPIIKTLRARKSRLRFPLLMGIISAPLILTNGRIIDAPGYDARTGLYFNPLDTVFPPIPASPTEEDAREALNLLGDLLEEFPFINGASKAVAMSGFLTAVCRRALDYAPMHGITAPDFGSGKSYLVDLFSMLSTGRLAPVIAFKKDHPEFDTRLESHLLQGLGVFSIDNVNGLLEGARLSQVLSQGAVEIRLFHTQGTVTIAPKSFIAATGVNLHVVDDLRRRTLLCSLDSMEERPELRTFENDPLSMIKEQRGKYVMAAITIIRAFMVNERTDQIPPLANYDQWCSMVRDPLLWLGCEDPCATMEEIRKQDSRLAIKTAIAALWLAIFEDKEKTAAAVIEEASRRDHEDKLIHREFHAVSGEIARTGKVLSPLLLGQWLGQVKDSVITLEITSNDQVTQAVRYRFESSLSKRTKIMLWRLAEIPKLLNL
jgi:hypothetical protein